MNTGEHLRIELMEAILDYLDGKKSFRTVLVLGITAHNRGNLQKYPNIAEVVSQLNAIENQLANGEGNKFSPEKIKDIFTDMLEKLIED